MYRDGKLEQSKQFCRYDTIKLLVADDPMNLKRKAFRLQMTVRKGDHQAALDDYEVLKKAIEEFKLQLERR